MLHAQPGRRLSEQVGSRAAVALILREGGSGLEALLIRRAEHPRDPWSGQMAFPGGRSEPGDADLAATAVREVAEETGLDLAHAGRLLGALDEVRAMARLRPMDLSIQPYVFALHAPAEAFARAEVSSVHWVAPERLLDPAMSGTFSRRAVSAISFARCRSYERCLSQKTGTARPDPRNTSAICTKNSYRG